jgi:hypothetical protein
VSALTVINGQLVVGGDFTTAGGVACHGIASWNGSSWQPLGVGMGAPSGAEPNVSALTADNGTLVAGGWFLTAGGITCDAIARWELGPAGTVQFSSATYSVSGTAESATITVTRTGDTTDGATVDYATSDGTGAAGESGAAATSGAPVGGVAGTDYTTTSGTLTFGQGETSKSFGVPILKNPSASADRTVNLTLSNPTGAAVLGGPNTAVLTITAGTAKESSGCGKGAGAANLAAFYALCWVVLACVKRGRRPVRN